MITNVSSPVDIVKPTKRKGCKVDNPHQNIITIKRLTDVTLLLPMLMRSMGLHFPSVMVLSIIIKTFIKDGTGITAYGISVELSLTGLAKGEITNTYHKLKRLQQKGYIEIIGSGRYNSNMYVPSKKALSEIEAICNQV